VDIELRVVAGVLVDGFDIAPNNQLGDGVDCNDMPFLSRFPYVGPPQNPRNHEHHLERGSKGRRYQDDDDSVSEAAPEDAATLARDASRGPALSLVSGGPGARAALQYTLENPGRVSLRVYDVQGRAVRTLVDQDAAAGTFRAQWDGLDGQGNAVRGVFFARLTADGKGMETKKIVVQ
jgi:hypothetical protein